MGNQNKICDVKITSINPPVNGELSNEIFRRCCFCEKNCLLANFQLEIVQKLSGPEAFYCPFCLRHRFNSRGNRDILVLSFRGVIGYLYFYNYLQANGPNKIWVSEIQDFIDIHAEAGLINPLFVYDPETLLWFIDFSKVGNSRKKIPLESVHKTVINILTSLDLHKIPGMNTSKFFQKYKDAIEVFHDRRFRPANKRLLLPTLTGCGVNEPKNFSFDRTRNFIFEDLEFKS